MLFAEKLKQLRKQNDILQRQMAAALDIDAGLYSKIERGERRAKREQVIIIAQVFHTDQEELLSLWLADRIDNLVAANSQQVANSAIKLVCSKYNSK
ncbi:MAG: helix-turn-helix transcriptional regulator [Anaerovoracaceae bacterium]